jgi:NAD(P)-dependent dehydrogenase (short-subunit alcohol dehydrogenase family)
MKQENKLAVITGAEGGIGSGIARALVNKGWDVVLNDLPCESESPLRKELAKSGSQVEFIAGDVSSEADVEGLFETVNERFKRAPDLLVNNAGVQTWKPLLELTLADWERTISTNLTGCFLNTRCFSQNAIKNNKGGVIINIGSGCNRLAFPNLVDYTASKGGVEMFTKSAALELGEHNIRVNCIAPGAIETERTRNEAGDYDASWSKLTPLGRVGKPSDVAAVVLLLADDAASFISGQTLGVDGGLFSRAVWPVEY